MLFFDEMTREQTMDAYAAVKASYGLKWRQRDALDADDCYQFVMVAAHENRWDDVRRYLTEAGII